MEIKNYTSAVNAYRAYSESSASSRIQKKKETGRTNTDKAEFSSASRASFAETLNAAASKAANSSASAERIAALRSQVKSGSYNVPAEDVAASILGF